jgi:hypothetical protein
MSASSGDPQSIQLFLRGAHGSVECAPPPRLLCNTEKGRRRKS